MFEGFEERRIETPDSWIHLVTAGAGPPLLLLHGYPQTHVMWHRVAPALAERFMVVAPDVRGYGASGKPPAGDDHAAYSKRAVAAELVEVMGALGHSRFGVAGHDRGGRVAYRLALDHPDRVMALAALDMAPTLDTWEQLVGPAGTAAYHWYFLAQPAPFPEEMIEPRAEAFLRHTIASWAGDVDAIGEPAMRAYVEAFTGEAIRGSCEDYRAGACIDPEIDRADREAGRRIACPVLSLWGDREGRRPPLTDVWRRWADDVSGRALDCGHFVAEEAPEDTIAELLAFFEKHCAREGASTESG
jgi:haloacetate dehalogenase